MIITQEELIKQIADSGRLDPAMVRNVFQLAETRIFACLTSATPSDRVTIKVLDGLTLECSYIPEKKIHTYDEIVCKPRIWAKPKITRYYNRKLNAPPVLRF